MKEVMTMKTNRFRLLTVLLAAVMLVALSLNVHAAQSNAVTQEGLTAQVFTDKDSYKKNESVNVTVRVDNHTGKEVSIHTAVTVPEGVTLASESAVYDAVLQDGQTWTTSGGVTSAEAVGNVMATGDHSHVGFWVVLAILAVCGIAALFVFGKNKKTWLSMLLCMAMIGGLVTEAIPVQAADISGSMKVSCIIQVDGKDSEVSATISYVIYDDAEDDDEAEESTEAVKPSEEVPDSSSAGESSESTEGSSESTEDGSESGEDNSESTEDGSESGEDSSESTEGGSESGEDSTESTEDSSESGEVTGGDNDSSEDSSESGEEGDESTEESSESGEEGDESTEERGDVSDSDDNLSEDEGEVIFDLTFDDLTTYEEGTDYVKGGGYKGAVTLSTEFDHTTGSGQSLKMAGRTVNYHRVKMLDALADGQLGVT